MARLRKGRANAARGAAYFLRETISRVRHAGANGALTMLVDSGFYTHRIVAARRKLKVRYSIAVRQQPSVRNLIEAIPEALPRVGQRRRFGGIAFRQPLPMLTDQAVVVTALLQS